MLYECKTSNISAVRESIGCRVAVGVAVLCILSTVNVPFRSCVSNLCPRGVIIPFLLSLEPVYQFTFFFLQREIGPKIASVLFFPKA